MITLVRYPPFLLIFKWFADDASSSVATLNPATMETLQLFRGDTIIVRYVHYAQDAEVFRCAN